MTFSPLQRKLLPDIAAISIDEICATLQPLRKEFVTTHIATSKRFEDRIVRSVLAENGVYLQDEAVLFEKEHILQALMSLPFQVVFQGLGLAWNADALAHAAVQDSKLLRDIVGQVTQDEVRIALTFRAHNKAGQVLITDAAQIVADGQKCFASWIADIPHQTHQLIRYACTKDGLALPDIEELDVAQRAELEQFCEAWCENRIALLSENQDDADGDMNEDVAA